MLLETQDEIEEWVVFDKDEDMEKELLMMMEEEGKTGEEVGEMMLDINDKEHNMWSITVNKQ